MPDDPSARRPRLTPAVADIRRAVRKALATDLHRSADAPPSIGGALVLVALSGGPDSLALAAATAFEAPRAGVRAGAIVVDHGLQQDSAGIADRAAGQARALGLDPVVVTRVDVTGPGGPESAARTARYRAIDAALDESGASHALLAHTLDDQAETVLLGLARGSGAASLQGMAPVSGRYLRPLLGIRRAATHRFCADSDLVPWLDPQNGHSAYTRVRVRQNVMPVLEAELGPGVAEALARTAEQLREDSDAFQTMIDEVIEDLVEHSEAGISVSVPALEANPVALQGRIVRFVVQSEFGVALERVHVRAILALVADWHGQKPLDLPGFTAARTGGRLVLSAAPASSAPDRP
ncbi:tRNA lysidine(34) synthetase TilS [Gryllotalpicola sp.]|uniref:tRNA lysidine(34) synthetase TilS n=1 Tax=Gryllotalpicola sp. TaxID=1932787 RepID=UPI00262D6FBE|nr:tRNA lysidine(34) synthetase TilS [Gryllotalpicola sp.]